MDDPEAERAKKSALAAAFATLRRALSVGPDTRAPQRVLTRPHPPQSTERGVLKLLTATCLVTLQRFHHKNQKDAACTEGCDVLANAEEGSVVIEACFPPLRYVQAHAHLNMTVTG